MRLLVVLASPPLMTSGRRTMARLEALAEVLPGYSVVVANLCAVPAVDLPGLSTAAVDGESWLRSRSDLASALADCDEVMAAWGLSALQGIARQHRRDQLEWLLQEVGGAGQTHMWTVGGQPRHPSRWHQYVSDKHGRTTGGTFDERLRQVLAKVPLDTLVRL